MVLSGGLVLTRTPTITTVRERLARTAPTWSCWANKDIQKENRNLPRRNTVTWASVTRSTSPAVTSLASVRRTWRSWPSCTAVSWILNVGTVVRCNRVIVTHSFLIRTFYRNAETQKIPKFKNVHAKKMLRLVICRVQENFTKNNIEIKIGSLSS